MRDILKKLFLDRTKSHERYVIELNYPTSSNNAPRWGYGKPPNAAILIEIEKNRSRYVSLLQDLLQYKTGFLSLNKRLEPYRDKPILANPWLPGLDSFALYTMIARYRPNTYLEIGSGISTRIARSAITDHSLTTRIISVDPEPRAEIDAICDHSIRNSLEDLDDSIFSELSENDILFLDSSHRSFMNSDVTIFFLDTLPRLAQGVIVEIHDIFLPLDYPPSWANRYYNEQYLLGAYILAGEQKLHTLLPNAFISNDPELRSLIDPVFSGPDMTGVSHGGGSFWLSISEQQCPPSA